MLGILAWASIVGVIDFVNTQFDVQSRGWHWFEIGLGIVALMVVVSVVFWDHLRKRWNRVRAFLR